MVGRRWLRGLVLGGALAVLAAAPAASGASAAPDSLATTWNGITAQGYPITFTVGRGTGVRLAHPLEFTADVPCEDGQLIIASFGFFGFDVPFEGDAFALDMVDLFTGFHWHGSLRHGAGHGTLAMNIPALTVDEHAQLCASGDVSWQASPGGVARPQPRPDVWVTVSKDAAGVVHVGVSRTAS